MLDFIRIGRVQKDFWLERWKRDEIGFHEGVVNAYLNQYWSGLNVAQGSRVFVPLCGKSVDVQWLCAQGYNVSGVELSSIAVRAFFHENSYAVHQYVKGKFDVYDANEIRIYCGDFFDLSRQDMVGVTAVYDRASMVALPPEMRARYVRHLVNVLTPGTKILLVTFDYPQQEMQGPPFAVSSAEVENLYGQYANISLLENIDALPKNPRFKQKGITRLQEQIYMLTLRGGTKQSCVF